MEVFKNTEYDEPRWTPYACDNGVMLTASHGLAFEIPHGGSETSSIIFGSGIRM